MIYVIYHANCPDGWGAAQLASEYLELLHPEAQLKLLEANYNGKFQHPDYQSEDIVWIVDFSFDVPTLNSIYSKVKQLEVFDHHESAKAIAELSFVTFDLNECGTTLVAKRTGLDYWWIPYVKDRDLWQWKLPNSKEVSAYFHILPKHTSWKYVEKDRAIAFGHLLLAKEQEQVTKICSNALSNSKAAIVKTNQLISECGSKLCETSSLAVMMIDRGKDGLTLSFRSKNGEALKAAELFGGGGHPNAAGANFNFKD